MPFEIRTDYFKLNEQQVLVPLTVALANQELTFKEEGGKHVAKVAFCGIVTSITNRIITEFEDDLVSAFQPKQLARGLRMGSIFLWGVLPAGFSEAQSGAEKAGCRY